MTMTEAGAGSEQAYVKPSDWTCEALYEMANKKRKALNLLLSSSRQSMHMTVLKGMAAPTKSVLPLWLRAFIMYAIGLKPGGRIDYDHLDSILDQGSSRQSCDISRFREWRQERYARKEEEEGVGEADEASLCGVAESNADAEGGSSEVGQAPTVKSRGPRWWFGNQSPCEPPYLGGGCPAGGHGEAAAVNDAAAASGLLRGCSDDESSAGGKRSASDAVSPRGGEGGFWESQSAIKQPCRRLLPES